MKNSQDNAREWEATRGLERISDAFADVPLKELEATIDGIIAEDRGRDRQARFAVIARMREAFAEVPPAEIEQEAERSVAASRERIRQRSESATRPA